MSSRSEFGSTFSLYGGMPVLLVRMNAENALPRQRIGRQHLAVAGGDRALALEAVALPAAVLHEGDLALGGVARGGTVDRRPRRPQRPARRNI